MRTVLLGGGVAALAGVVSGLVSWSDITAQTMAKSPRLEVPFIQDAGYARSALGDAPDQVEHAAYAPSEPAFDLRRAFVQPVAWTQSAEAPTAQDALLLEEIIEPADAPSLIETAGAEPERLDLVAPPIQVPLVPAF